MCVGPFSLSLRIHVKTRHKLATRMATAMRYAPFQEFQSDESITAYLERLEMYFLANDVEEEKKVPLLLSHIGAKTYGLLRSLAAPSAPKEKTFKDLEKILKDHFEPTPSVIAERYRFHRRDQAVGESIGDYVAEL